MGKEGGRGTIECKYKSTVDSIIKESLGVEGPDPNKGHVSEGLVERESVVL